MTIRVNTSLGPGQVWGIDRGKIIVEMDWQYLVGYPVEQVERVEGDED